MDNIYLGESELFQMVLKLIPTLVWDSGCSAPQSHWAQWGQWVYIKKDCNISHQIMKQVPDIT